MPKQASKIQIGNTIDFWRQQFNNIVDMTETMSLSFTTPQHFANDDGLQKLITDGTIDATPYFNMAKSSGRPIYVPAGLYHLTENIDGSRSFFAIGGVRFKTEFTCTFAYNLDPLAPYINSPVSYYPAANSPYSLINKSHLDATVVDITKSIDDVKTLIINENKDRLSVEDIFTEAIATTPSAGSWWKGYVKVSSSGDTQIGKNIKLHNSHVMTNDYSHLIQSSTTGVTVGSFSGSIVEFHNDGRITAPSCSLDLYSGSAALTNNMLVTKHYLDLRNDNITNWVSEYFFNKKDGDTSTTKMIFKNKDSTLFTTDVNASNVGLEIFQSSLNHDAYMTFHVAGDWAVRFGLDGTTNDLSVGGHSFGNNKYRILHEGNKEKFAPRSGDWWGDYFPMIRSSDGGMEIGKYVDFHVDSDSGDHSVRMSVSSWEDENVPQKSVRAFNISSEHRTDIAGVGTFPSVQYNLTDGYYSFLLGNATVDQPWRGGVSFRHPNISDNAAWDKSYTKREFLYIGNMDQGGGARIRGLYRKSSIGHPALMLEGALNDDGQTEGEWATVSANAYSVDSNGAVIASNGANNIFGAYNNGSVRFTVKGDGRAFVNGPMWNWIDADNQLTTKSYVDKQIKGYINFGANGEPYSSKNLTVSRVGAGRYLVTLAAGIRSNANYAPMVGAVDVPTGNTGSGWTNLSVYTACAFDITTNGFYVYVTRRFSVGLEAVPSHDVNSSVSFATNYADVPSRITVLVL